MNRWESERWTKALEEQREADARKRDIDRHKTDCVDCNGNGVSNAYYTKCAKCYGTGLGEIKVESILTEAFAPYLK